MPRVFLSSPPGDKPIRITGTEAKYILAVLRCGKGDALTFIDPDGNFWGAEITETSGRALSAVIKERLPAETESPLRLSLLQGILKGQKMDLVIQKATELGVKEIVPLILKRTQITETRKLGRWRKIAKEASRQSGRGIVPLVRPPMGLEEFLSSSSGRLKGLIFWEEGGMRLKEAVAGLVETASPEDEVIAAIGPEGGFTAGEVEDAKAAGLRPVFMGERILRAETAAIAAVAVLEVMMGDMG
ncbi:MAG: 16S rRNA (uracil(1498)-N(3))-methyltransferase [Thermodesulfovibrionales bacterium]|nr:16S rRNA (uracil(1498)-N(3))-methyltransferase [Thermodesulfovibrionales bacterium]